MRKPKQHACGWISVRRTMEELRSNSNCSNLQGAKSPETCGTCRLCNTCRMLSILKHTASKTCGALKVKVMDTICSQWLRKKGRSVSDTYSCKNFADIFAIHIIHNGVTWFLLVSEFQVVISPAVTVASCI